MKEKINRWFCDYIQEYEKRGTIETKWGKPLIGYADANSAYIQNLPALISPGHGLPQDVIPDASIVIAYYVPFTRELAGINRTGTEFAAPEWARAYEETNAMFLELNQHLIKELEVLGYRAGTSPLTAGFDQEKLISNWSYRHFAYAAGLGSFGVNHMLITKRGCCGRYNTVVTNLDVTPDQPVKEEYCLYKKNGTCGICIRNCPSGALGTEGFARQTCYALLRKNAAIYTEFGNSYSHCSDSGSEENFGSEVCGKCITQSPCAFWNLP